MKHRGLTDGNYKKKSENWTPPRQTQIDDFDTTFDPACHGTGGPVQNGYSHYNYPQNRESLSLGSI